ncbi:hypothetical protein B0T16DRAFT_124989 [Cercophora newfieldiana]|uniref:Uncharacterized protein n=1 Tax=Cercophora newfieldiana TaxID=92897 RepID=A0AA40CTT4_9PEZI|nr:hypothetical protein B0T16DRAFT_124989 [Cercophora newfieldiana]
MYHSTNRILRKYRFPKDRQEEEQPDVAIPRAAPKMSKLPKISAPKLSLDLGPRSPRSPLGDIIPSPFDRSELPLIQTPSISTPSGSSQHGSARFDPDERPPWDRSVDIVWRRRLATPDSVEWDDELAFQENSARLASQSASTPTASPLFGNNPPSWYRPRDLSRKDNARYFALPDRVRFIITKYVLASHDSGKSIRLNSPSFLDPIWPVNPIPKSDWAAKDSRIWSTEYFDSLKKVLALIRGYTSVCFAMRIDVMTTLFLTRRFHVVYSPFVTEIIQPAATLYMDEFGALMKSITLEIDLSRLGGSWEPAAEKMDMEKSVKRVKALVKRFANIQLDRRGVTTIQSLVILVRRYYGHRHRDEEFEEAPRMSCESERSDDHAIGFEDDDDDTVMFRKESGYVPYCSDEHLSVLDPLKLLEGVIDSFCVVGANSAYAKSLMIALWGKDRPPNVRDYCQYRTPSLAYPFTPGQRSAVVNGPGQGVTIVEHVRDPRRWKGLYGCALSPSAIVTEVQRDGYPPSYRVMSKAGEDAGPWATPRISTATLFPPVLEEPKLKKASFSARFSKKDKSKGKGKENKKEKEKEADSPDNSPTSPNRHSPSRIPVLSRRSAGSGKMMFASSSGSSDTEQESGGSSGSSGVPGLINRRPSQGWRVIGKGLAFGKKSGTRD